MAQNIIAYGPPGTGKTYYLQSLMNKYTNFILTDNFLKEIYKYNSKNWLIIALIIIQNNEPMSPKEIADKLHLLGIKLDSSPSAILETHSQKEFKIGIKKNDPLIFIENQNKWYVDILQLNDYDKELFVKINREELVERRYVFVSFHQSFSYEDFVEGIRPKVIDGKISYEVKPGIFKSICKIAKDNPLKQYALFIDEINRGNISEIFGELISLIEIDKREGSSLQLFATLPYSNEKFSVPKNLSIYGTMNSADKSISLLDTALRRRFEFVNFNIDYELLQQSYESRGKNSSNIDGVDVVKLLKAINNRVELLLDHNHLIGHAYFMNLNSFQDVKKVLIGNVIPLLEEYFYDDFTKIQLILNDLDVNGDLNTKSILKHSMLIAEDHINYIADRTIIEKKKFELNFNFTNDSVKKIYNE